MARRLGVSDGQALLLPLVFRLGLVPAPLLAGLLIDHWGVAWILIGGSLLAALGIAGLALGKRMPLVLATGALAGASAAAVGVASSVLMPPALVLENPAIATNLGSVFLVVGLLAAPAGCNVLLDRLGFRRMMGLLSLFCLAPALAAALTVPEAFPPPAQPIGPALPMDDVLFWAVGMAFVLCGPLEQLLITRATPYLTGFGFGVRRTAWLLTGFWLALLGSQLLAALLLDRVTMRPSLEAWSLLGLVVAATVLLGNLAGTTSRSYAGFGVLLLGFCLGPVMPTLVGMVFDQYPTERGAVGGALFALAAGGSLVLLPTTDAAARRTETERALRGPLVLALLLSATLLVLGLLLADKR
jgi:DHA1 family bicyclomycin/chloramphenicol resistance-like MFS transporter